MIKLNSVLSGLNKAKDAAQNALKSVNMKGIKDLGKGLGKSLGKVGRYAWVAITPAARIHGIIHLSGKASEKLLAVALEHGKKLYKALKS